MRHELRSERGQAEAIVLFVIGVVVLALVVGVVWLAMWGLPKYRVYSRSLTGQAELAQAEYNRRITIEEANATLEAASALSRAEVERARGVAEANQIIGESLQGNDAYLRYLWVQGLHDGSSETIYIPTEAQLPILEATRPVR